MGAIGMGGGHVTLSHSRFVPVVWASVAIGFPVLSTDRCQVQVSQAPLSTTSGTAACARAAATS